MYHARASQLLRMVVPALVIAALFIASALAHGANVGTGVGGSVGVALEKTLSSHRGVACALGLSGSRMQAVEVGRLRPAARLRARERYVDEDGDGVHRVTVDAADSIPAAVSAADNGNGKIVDAVWTDTVTSRTLSRSLRFSEEFPVGTTRLSLTITDNACRVRTYLLSVRVDPKLTAGVYCYYYPKLKRPPNGDINAFPRPSYSAISPTLRLPFNSVPIANRRLVARCFFLASSAGSSTQSVVVSADLRNSGYALVLDGAGRVVLDSRKNGGKSSRVSLKKGGTPLELVYVYTTTTVDPYVNVLFNGKPLPAARLSHDRAAVVPILTAALPNSAYRGGGLRIRLTGTGLFAPLTVTFGGIRAQVVSTGADGTEVIVRVPRAEKLGFMPVVVSSAAGTRSNGIPFRYVKSRCTPPAFNPTKLSMTVSGSRSDVDLIRQPTCVTLGPDRRLYIGVFDGSVAVLGYDSISLRALTYCVSKPVTDASFRDSMGNIAERRILGITFNPAETSVLPYVSTSTSEWWSRNNIARSNLAAWRNGAVDRMRLSANPGNFPINARSKSNPPVCVQYDKRIVSGLPVANGGGHSVNALEFTPGGDLLIAVGGTSNMGLPGFGMGNTWESPLSAALLIARLSLGASFDGNVRYSNANIPFLAKKIGGDVDVYASGMRNMFGITMTTRGVLYGLDQGPACKLGGPAVACNEFKASAARKWDIDGEANWPTRVPAEEPGCPGRTREDELLHLLPGKYYGHANLQRGVRGECAWVDPSTGKTADGKQAPGNYQGPMTMFPASATSIREYGAAHFCGAMRGDLVISTFRGVTTWRARVNGGRLLSQPDILGVGAGGLSFAEDEHGNLVFPRFSARSVDVLRPRTFPPSRTTVIGVWPRWHRRTGGSTLYIGGYGFSSSCSVRVGGAACIVQKGASRNREISCSMPSRSAAGSNLVNVRVTCGKNTSTLNNAVAYMSS